MLSQSDGSAPVFSSTNNLGEFLANEGGSSLAQTEGPLVEEEELSVAVGFWAQSFCSFLWGNVTSMTVVGPSPPVTQAGSSGEKVICAPNFERSFPRRGSGQSGMYRNSHDTKCPPSSEEQNSQKGLGLVHQLLLFQTPFQ